MKTEVTTTTTISTTVTLTRTEIESLLRQRLSLSEGALLEWTVRHDEVVELSATTTVQTVDHSQ
jgi:hypothetical protein